MAAVARVVLMVSGLAGSFDGGFSATGAFELDVKLASRLGVKLGGGGWD